MKKETVIARQKLALEYFEKAHIVLTEEEKAAIKAEAAGKITFFAEHGKSVVKGQVIASIL